MALMLEYVFIKMSNITKRTKERINYLLDSKSVDSLLDEFQSDGMPMGNNRWADYCLFRYKELREKERLLRKLLGSLSEMDDQVKNDPSSGWRAKRRKLTEEFQERGRIEEERQNEIIKYCDEFEKEIVNLAGEQLSVFIISEFDKLEESKEFDKIDAVLACAAFKTDYNLCLALLDATFSIKNSLKNREKISDEFSKRLS